MARKIIGITRKSIVKKERMMKVLIVEDENSKALQVKKTIVEAGFNV